MTDKLTPEQLAEWETLAKAATPGPWEYDYNGDDGHEIRMASAIEHGGCYRPQHIIEYGHMLEHSDGAAFDEAEANAAFVVASRTAVPALIAEVRRLAEKREAYEAVRTKGTTMIADLTVSLTNARRARDAALAREKALREALTPSAATKAEYIGEFKFSIPDHDEDGEECPREVTVEWTAIKEIMSAILARAEAAEAEIDATARVDKLHSNLSAALSQITELTRERDEWSEKAWKAAGQRDAAIACEAGLREALTQFLENVEEPPDRNCSCHISPPCSDCTDNSGLREAFEIARVALAAALIIPPKCDPAIKLREWLNRK